VALEEVEHALGALVGLAVAVAAGGGGALQCTRATWKEMLAGATQEGVPWKA
jgi:hypothetical protein